MSELRRGLQALWFQPVVSPRLWILLPLELAFAALAAARRLAYRSGLFGSASPGRPVVVVGNIAVGGTGKTPLVIWLTERLVAAGRRPGIIARGFGGSAAGVRPVLADSDPAEVGDEPVLLAQRTGRPVFVGRDRVAAGQALLAANPDVDVLVSDDGLQHYRLRRSVEVAIVDGRRGFGNAHLLPVGPLRETPDRLRRVDAVVVHGGAESAAATGPAPHFAMSLAAEPFVRLDAEADRCEADRLRGRRLCALAGIGDPQRFFAALRALGLEFESRAFPDHHAFVARDLEFAHGSVLLMTEKDAVKCRGLFPGEAWFMPVSARIEPDLAALVLEKIDGPETA